MPEQHQHAYSYGWLLLGASHPDRRDTPRMVTLDLRRVASPAVRDLLNLVNHPDFDRAQQQIERLGGCTEPVRLTGHTTTVDTTTGEVLRSYSTDTEPTGSLLTACGNRRSSRCPACSR